MSLELLARDAGRLGELGVRRRVGRPPVLGRVRDVELDRALDRVPNLGPLDVELVPTVGDRDADLLVLGLAEDAI